MAEVARSSEAARLNPAHALLMGLGLLALAFLVIALVVAVTTMTASRIDSALAIAGGLIVLIIALAGLACVLSALGLSNHPEAFALPGGSIRSVLALGVLTALVFFALSQFDSTFAPRVESTAAGIPMTIVSTPEKIATEEAAQVKQLRAQGVVLVPTGGSPTERSYLVFHPKENRDGSDFAKQLLTMFGTLLTAIMSFYFGSRIAGRAQAPTPVGQAKAGSDAGSPVPAATAQAQLNALQTRRAAASGTLNELTALRDAARAEAATLPEADQAPALATLTEAEASLAELQDRAQQADAALSELEAALKGPAAAQDGVPAGLVTAAADKTGALQDAVAATFELREQLESITQAEG